MCSLIPAGIIQLGLRVTPIDEFNLHVYSDVDWGGDSR